MPKPPTRLYARVARGYLTLAAAYAMLAVWLPIAIVHRLLTMLSESMMAFMESTEEAAQRDIAAVKSWKAWNNLSQDKMYLSICHGAIINNQSRESVAEKLHKMRAWSKEAGSPLHTGLMRCGMRQRRKCGLSLILHSTS